MELSELYAFLWCISGAVLRGSGLGGLAGACEPSVSNKGDRNHYKLAYNDAAGRLSLTKQSEKEDFQET